MPVMRTPFDVAARHLAAIVESSDDAILSKDLDGHILSWNRGAERTFGFTADEVLGKSIFIIVPDDRQSEEAAVLARIRQGHQVEHFETFRRCRNGTLVPVSITSSPVRDEDGRVVAVSTIARDVSQQKQGEAALAAAKSAHVDLQRRLLTLVAASRSLVASPDVTAILSVTVQLADQLVAADAYAVWRLNPAGTEWQPIAAVGVSPDFIRGVPAGESVPFTDAQAVTDVQSDPRFDQRRADYAREGIRSLLLIPLSVIEQWSGTLVLYYRRPHEFTQVDIETARALGNLAAAAMTTAELYERQQRQQLRAEFLAEAGARLARSLDYIETLTAVANLIVLRLADWCAVDLVDDDGKWERVAIASSSPSMRDWAKDFMGQWRGSAQDPAVAAAPLLVPRVTDEMLIRVAGANAEHLARLRELGVVSYMRVPLVTRGGVVGAISLANRASAREFGSEDLQFAEELATRAAMTVENSRAYEDARRANRVKDDFLATLSHELRTPLNAILGYARMLRTGAVHEERKGHALLVVERNALALAQIVGDVLDVSRIVAGKLRLSLQPVDLREVIVDAADTVSQDARARDVRLTVPETRDPIEVHGDAARLQQVIWNLLSNAIKFTPPGGEVRVAVDPGDHQVTVRVCDTGVGIAPTFLPHIFEPFRQADSKPSREFGGLGLGLAIVRRLVELHNGTVEVESAGVGCGSEFRVILPTRG